MTNHWFSQALLRSPKFDDRVPIGPGRVDGKRLQSMELRLVSSAIIKNGLPACTWMSAGFREPGWRFFRGHRVDVQSLFVAILGYVGSFWLIRREAEHIDLSYDTCRFLKVSGGPRWPYIAPTCSQDGHMAKIASMWLQDSPKWPKMAPKSPNMASIWPKDGPKRAQDSPNIAPTAHTWP
jgi:hypothetical protein